ncbi:Helix-turn-helix [Treponema bryantii]|uniref:Helix-turn-helix n=1 Tax=Treponema bryantii TaxID=163 RepID=A0A1H9B3Z2_9SPIR|nr:LexA family transcriptional regulator [Treponema bryantii]SEP83752.1 Helix-turn-helix [Treponema bryantii]
MTFWERVEQALEQNNITEAELSRRIGVSQAGITGWKQRGSIPRADVAIKTAEVLNTSVDYLVNGSLDTMHIKKSNTFLVPILNQELSAGKGELLPEDDIANGLVPIPYRLHKEFGNNLAALHVHGDSMKPTLNDGDMIVCDSLGWDNSDGIYAIRMNGSGFVKRIQVVGQKILVISDNPKYKTFEESVNSDAIQIIGKVRLVIQAL